MRVETSLFDGLHFHPYCLQSIISSTPMVNPVDYRHPPGHIVTCINVSGMSVFIAYQCEIILEWAACQAWWLHPWWSLVTDTSNRLHNYTIAFLYLEGLRFDSWPESRLLVFLRPYKNILGKYVHKVVPVLFFLSTMPWRRIGELEV